MVEALRFCRDQGLPVAARGQGHSTAGQAQVEGGLVIDMSPLCGIGSIQDGVVRVQGGATWRQVLSRSVPLGWSPPVVTGYTGLSVGGTLSMGGIGAASFRHGAQVDNVLALQVVTGEGELVTCSPSELPELFSAVLGGVGQYGVIVEATLALTPVAPRARYHLLGYDDADAFFATCGRSPRGTGSMGSTGRSCRVCREAGRTSCTRSSSSHRRPATRHCWPGCAAPLGHAPSWIWTRSPSPPSSTSNSRLSD